MTPEEIRLAFPTWTPVYLSDAGYAKPTVRWLTQEFWPWYKQQRENMGLGVWTRKSDCDDFARSFSQYAADCHALTSGNEEEGLAVFEYWYIGTTHVQGAHAIVCAFTDEGRIFVEPQNGQRIALSPTETQSAFFVRG